MMALLSDKAFDDPDWVFEIKWDGYRAIADITKSKTELYSRNGLSFANDYQTIYEELKKIKQDIVLDGEIVALDKNGIPKFQFLQQYERDKSHPLVYYVFDCLRINGKSIIDKPLIERKKLLKDALPKSNVILYCDHVAEHGIAFFDEVRKEGLEGMIAKRASSPYQLGKRGHVWLKVKNLLEEEAVIAGFTEGRGSREYFGALILGAYR